jgi:hypothetical protein
MYIIDDATKKYSNYHKTERKTTLGSDFLNSDVVMSFHSWRKNSSIRIITLKTEKSFKIKVKLLGL